MVNFLKRHCHYVNRYLIYGKKIIAQIRSGFNKFPDFFVQAFRIVVDS